MRQANVQFALILTKIIYVYSDKLNDRELTLIQSQFFSKAEVNIIYPSGIHIFNKNHSVHEYNHQILSAAI